MAQHRLHARPKHPDAVIVGYLVKFTADSDDEPITSGTCAYSIVGRVFDDEFTARAFWASIRETAEATWVGHGKWRYDMIKGYWTDGDRPGKQF